MCLLLTTDGWHLANFETWPILTTNGFFLNSEFQYFFELDVFVTTLTCPVAGLKYEKTEKKPSSVGLTHQI